MSNVIGIGAAPRRKEDSALPDRPRQLRRRHQARRTWRSACSSARRMAHAAITSASTRRAALALPGVDRRVDRRGCRGRRRSARCPAAGAFTGKDGLPMKEPPFPMLAQGKVRFVGDMVAFVVAETLEQARRGRRSGGRSTMRCCRRSSACSKPFGRARRNCSTTCRTTSAATGSSATRPRSTTAFKKAAHVARLSLVNNRLIGNPMEPRAAIAEYNGGDRPLHAVDHQPVSARRAVPDGRPGAQHSRSTRCAWWRPTSAAASASSNSTTARRP